jgi:Outer membrane protein transport protein (OMPP1/FadL/TodX).
MFGSYGRDGEYVGVTETFSLPDGDYHYLAGPLAQTSYQTKLGSKNDLVMNLGLNFSDRFYLGFNLGIPTARYRYQESFYEAAVNPDRFLIRYDDGHDTCFRNGTFNYQYLADVAGVYAKIGVILRPVDGLRLGASFQTPTAFTISETWMYSASTTFDDSYYNDSVSSPQGEFSYTLRSPYRASFGAAFTFGKQGFISVDYELADYSVMRFRSLREGRISENAFVAENWANRYFTGVSHAFRLGAELRLTPEWSLRAGYNLTTSPERWWTASDGQQVTVNDFYADPDAYFNRIKNLVTPHYYNDRTHAFSAGIGYSSPGSFFLDAAVRMIRYPVSTFAPYFDYECYDSAGDFRLVEAPRIQNHRDLWNVSLTFGWRF